MLLLGGDVDKFDSQWGVDTGQGCDDGLNVCEGKFQGVRYFSCVFSIRPTTKRVGVIRDPTFCSACEAKK